MTISIIVRPLAIAATMLAMATVHAVAEDASIFQATLAEANQKTGEVSTEQLRQILTDDSGTVVDTRTRLEFEAGHIPGARNLDGPPSEHVAAVERLMHSDKGTALVLYCNGPYCQASRRLADQLVAAGFTNVRRYQLGIPIWRALGGPTAIELGGIVRIFGLDKTAVYLDARSSGEFANGSLPGAQSAPVEDVVWGKLKNIALPQDDFNRRVVLFGRDGTQALKLAEVLSKRPWHNVTYFPGTFEALAAAVRAQ